MEYRRLGRTGLKVSTFCLGSMQFGWSADEATSVQVLNKAVELGCNFIDTADIYSSWSDGNEGGESETIIGRWLVTGAVRRDELVIASKVRGKMGPSVNDEGLSRQHIMNAIDNSLRRLKTDYIDLYQVHWPDEETLLDETLIALDDLVRSGKVRYIGCSNYPAWLLVKSLWISDVRGISRFDSLQPHYNLVHRAEFERELQAVCLDQMIGVIAYSPLGGGFLTGKYQLEAKLPDSKRASGVQRQYMNEEGFAAVGKLEEIALAKGATIAQTAIAWVLANPSVTSAIVGANNTDQLTNTIKSVEITLNPEDKLALDEISTWT